jgi:hypothetical protein
MIFDLGSGQHESDIYCRFTVLTTGFRGGYFLPTTTGVISVHDRLCCGLNQSQHGYFTVVIYDPCERTSFNCRAVSCFLCTFVKIL